MAGVRQWIYDTVIFLLNHLVVDHFFREVTSRGGYQVPREGPLLFVLAPHSNQFVDPLILFRHCPRRVGFLIAQKSYRRRLVGWFARALHAIPVVRPQDESRDAKASVYADPDGDAHILLANDEAPSFLDDGIKPKDMLQLRLLPSTESSASTSTPSQPPPQPQHQQQQHQEEEYLPVVAEILGARKLRLSQALPAELRKRIAGPKHSVSFRVQPYVDQSEVYVAVHERLNAGECVGIFPEGGSHDRAEMLPLKAGATLMALGAMAQNPDLDVKIVPCGLSYFNPHRFRSRAVIEFGKPITIPRKMVQQFAQGGAAKREACGELLQIIYRGLRAVTVTAPDFETLQVIQAARRLYVPNDHHLSIPEKLEIQRRLAEGYQRLKDRPRVHALSVKILQYNERLAAFGIRDHQVEKTELHAAWALVLLVVRILKLVVLSVLVLPGFLLNAPIARIASSISKRKAKEAKQASSVKIAGRDVIATWKLMVTFVLIPFVYVFVALGLTVWGHAYVPALQTWSPVFTFITCYTMLPLISMGTLVFFESATDIYKSLPPLLYCIKGGDETMELRLMRHQLQHDITLMVDELGPEIFPGLEQESIVKRKVGMNQQDIIGQQEEKSEWLAWKEVTDDEAEGILFF